MNHESLNRVSLNSTISLYKIKKAYYKTFRMYIIVPEYMDMNYYMQNKRKSGFLHKQIPTFLYVDIKWPAFFYLMNTRTRFVDLRVHAKEIF